MHVYARYFSNEIDFFLESSKELCERRHIQSLPNNGGRSGMSYFRLHYKYMSQ